MMLSLFVALSLGVVHADGGAVPTAASWIWYPEQVASEGVRQTRYLRRVVRLAQPPTGATLRVLADDSVEFSVNGKPAPAPGQSGPAGRVYDLTRLLRPGENVLAFAVYNAAGKGGLIVSGVVRERGGALHRIRSDASFRASRQPVPGWKQPGFDDSKWPPAKIVGGAFAPPWYRHPAFDLDPFLEPADRARWDAWRRPLLVTPASLATEAPARAKFAQVNGTCALVIDGTPRPALIYRGTVDPFSEHGRRQIGLFRDAGVHVYTAYLPLSLCWVAPGKYRFDSLDDTVRAYLSADPQGYLIFILRLVPPNWWMAAHEHELVRYAAGDDFNTSDESGRVRRPSLASKVWQHDALAIWRAAIRHLEKAPWGKRVIGYQPGYGIYTEWHYFGSWRQQMPDTGPAMTARFRAWLRKRYRSVERLRRAWGTADVSFATAAVPGVQPRLAAGPLGFRRLPAGQRVIDYYRCQQEVTAADLDMFCAAAKEITGGRVICGAFYGYFQEVPPQTQGGHLELERLLGSPNIDYFAAPYAYAHRLVGDDGRPRSLVDAFPLAGKVHMIEADTRTHLHPRDEYGRVTDVQESLAVIRREVATALIHGCALWWCDFGSDGSGGWYDHPALIGEVARLVGLAERRLHTPHRRLAQVAVIADPKSCYFLGDGPAMRTHARLVDEVTTALYRTGTPFDMILLSQLDKADLPRYRLLVFLNTLCVDGPTRSLVATAVRGRSVLWLWAPGITDGHRFDPALVQPLTGFHVALQGHGLPATVVTCFGDSLLTRRVPQHTTWTLTPRDAIPVTGFMDAANWYNPRDKATMDKYYARFAWRIEAGALRWEFATTKSWTDIHLKAAMPRCEGLGLKVRGEGIGAGLALRVVVKGGDGGQFVAPAIGVTRSAEEHVLPFAAFTKAPWYRGKATKITFPLTGLKLVLDGTGGNRRGALLVGELTRVHGVVSQHKVRVYGDPGQSVPVLTITDPAATPLGRDAATGAVLLAAAGPPGARRVLSTVPFVPAELLTALMDDAGVCRYLDTPDVIVRADSGLVALHTARGGEYVLHLPFAARLRDAFTGTAVGAGRSITLQLPPKSTTLLAIEPLAGR